MSDKLREGSNNILLTNLIKIRWLAIIGQILAILISYYYFEIEIPILACLLIVVVSSLVNFFSFFTKKINNYLSDKEAFYFLLFDTLQLGILLYLTGGIYNPFSLLLIAPLIISASYLPIVYSIVLSLLSINTVILISNFYIQINWNTTFVVPEIFKHGLTLSLIISLLFITIYVYLFASSNRGISQALFQTKSALANQKKMSELGSLSTAAVHELSTPINTIFLILDDLRDEDLIKKNTNIKKEIELLKSQAERCRSILLTLSKSPENLKDNFFKNTTLSNIIKINFDKFNDRNIILNLKSKIDEPLITFKDELMYGLGNIIQNSIQHAKKTVDVTINNDLLESIITIKNDGPKFSKEILDQIGKPYISKKKSGIGMGLGIFITKNLLENEGSHVSFSNSVNNIATVEIIIKHAT